MSHKKIDVKKLSKPIKKKHEIKSVNEIKKPNKVKIVPVPRRRKV